MCVVFGIGGVGKSALAYQLTHVGAKTPRRTIWCSLTNAPSLDDLVRGVISLFPERDPAPDASPEGQLLECLTRESCFLVLDNLEVLLDSERFPNQFRPAYEDYGPFLRLLASTPHTSTVIVTSRENPSFLRETSTPWVRSLHLQGLPKMPARTLLARRGLRGDVRLRGELVSRYDGNPLAIQLASDLIADVHDGSIARFFESGEFLFGELEDLFHQHFERLSEAERLVLFRLAAARRPLTVREISGERRFRLTDESAATILQRLRRRSLVQEREGCFYLQYMIQEFVTARLNIDCAQEVLSGAPDVLGRFALVDASCPEHVREAQRRFLASPVAALLQDRLGTREQVGPGLHALLDASRAGRPHYGSFTAANTVSVLGAGSKDLAGRDLSRLVLRQLDLSDLRLADANARSTEFAGCRFPGVYHYIFALEFSPEGRIAAIGQSGGAITLVSVPGGTRLRSLLWEADWIRALAFSPHGGRLACADERGRLRVWDLTTNLPTDFVGHERQARGLVFSSDGRTLFSAGEDRRILAWSVEPRSAAPRLVAELEAEVWGLHSAPVAPLIAAACDDRTLRVWDWNTGEEFGLEASERVAGRCVRFSMDGRHVFVGCDDGMIRVWSSETGRLVARLPGHTASVWALAVSRTAAGETLVTGSHDETLRLWNVSEASAARCERVINSMDGPVWPVAADTEGRYFATAGRNTTIRFWDTRQAECLEVLAGSSGTLLTVAGSPDGRLIASGGHDRSVRLWDAGSGECLAELAGHSAGVRALAFHPDGALLASAGEDWDVRLWDVHSHQLRAVLEGSRNWLWSVVFEPNGHSVAAAGADALIRLWDVQGRGGAQVLAGHEARVRGIQYTQDGRDMVSVGEDGQIRLWDVAAGTSDLVGVLGVHVTCVQVVGDGRCVTGTSDGSVRLWDLAAKRCLNEARAHEGAVLALAPGPPGADCVLSAGQDGRVRVWNLPDLVSGAVLQEPAGAIRSLAWFRPGPGAVADLSEGGTGATGTRSSREAEVSLAAVGSDEAIRAYTFPEFRQRADMRVARQFEGLDITGCRGLTDAQLSSLTALGAVELPGTARPRGGRTGGKGGPGGGGLPGPPEGGESGTGTGKSDAGRWGPGGGPDAPVVARPSGSRAARMFISYSHRDDGLRAQLDRHLSALRWKGLVDSWHDRQIRPGDEWLGEIDENLEGADVILLLVSADFLASEYCRDIEMRRAMERHREGSATVVPVVLRDCDWQEFPFAEIQGLPLDGRAVTAWPNPDAAFTDIAVRLRMTLEDLAQRRTRGRPHDRNGTG